MQDIDGQWFDIGSVREFRIGHNGGGVTVDKNHLVTFFAEGLAGLCARIVKFTRLTDHNRPRTNNQNRL